jgi:hypothetical protein
MWRGNWNRSLMTAGCSVALTMFSGCVFPGSNRPGTPPTIARDEDSTQSHAWKLLSSYLQPAKAVGSREVVAGASDPVWMHWDNKCSLPEPHLSKSCPNPKNGMQLAVQTPEKDSTHLLSTVFFNDALAGWMKENHVAEAGVPPKICWAAGRNDSSRLHSPSSLSLMLLCLWRSDAELCHPH